MSRPNGYTAQQFIDAIPGSAGIISTIAKRVGCNWNTAQRYINEMPTVKAVYDAEAQKPLDMAESVLFKNIELAYKITQTGQMADSSDAKWILARKGKDRGYVERQEQVNFDLSKCTDEQLQRIANGEHPATVLANTSNR